MSVPGVPGYMLVILGADGEPTYDVNGNPVGTGVIVDLPIIQRIGVEYGTERYNETLETERGRRWVVTKFERQVRRMRFRITLAQLVGFETLDLAVGGDRDPFFFIVDTDESPTERIFCRKESGFIVRQVEQVMHGAYVDYEMSISEEPAGPEITD